MLTVEKGRSAHQHLYVKSSGLGNMAVQSLCLYQSPTVTVIVIFSIKSVHIFYSTMGRSINVMR